MFAGSLLIGFIGYMIGIMFSIFSIIESRHWVGFIIVIIMAFLGSVVDSIIGATVQATFRCVICNKETEKKIHCLKPSILVHGNPAINNDTVNFIASAFAGVLTFITMVLIV